MGYNDAEYAYWDAGRELYEIRHRDSKILYSYGPLPVISI